MTEKTEKVVFENPDGEVYDVYGAFDRHPALTGRNADTDISVDLNPSYEMEFTIKVGAGTMARLVQILNSAPVDGNPLNAIVNLELDSTAGTWARERIARYLADVGANPTLENCAAGYLYEVGENKLLKIDVAAGEYKEYAVTSVISKSDSTKSRLSRGHGTGLSSVTFGAPDNPVTIVSENSSINLEDLAGVIIANGEYRIMHALEPGGKSPLGGFILERIEEGDD